MLNFYTFNQLYIVTEFAQNIFLWPTHKLTDACATC